MTELSKNYIFNSIEKKWQDYWQERKIYAFDKNDLVTEKYIVDTPPPTVSGQLHMGHIYSYANADFITRFQRMKGKNVFYPIGFDDNGLPTERLVEKQKNIRAVNTNRVEFKKICNEIIIKEEDKFRELFNKIALSVDWSLEYQTISTTSQTISQMSFLDLVNKGEAYRNTQPILWDPIDQTALAQVDIEDKEKLPFMNDIIFKSDKGLSLIIATTRPELLPAICAVLYHPDDERYKDIGTYAFSPLFGVKVPLLADELVIPEKGTGLVMCCTFGDQTDIIWQKKHNLPINIILNKRGQVEFSDEFLNKHSEEAIINLDKLKGLKVTDARAKIIEILKAQDLLVKQVEINQTVKCAERSGAPLEILTTNQWFIKTIEHKEALLDKVNQINWYPKSMKIRLDNWINGISWDWCISRQRYFGVPFPIWYSKRAGEEGKILLADKSQLPVDPSIDLPIGYERDEVEADLDIMDTWATSSVSPQLVSLGISDKFYLNQEQHKNLFPSTLRTQGHDIIRSWAFYTILKAHLHENRIPWQDIMVSGWCLAEDRSKMSKSKGNIISPLPLLEQHSSDVIRYWAATAALGADTSYSEDVIKSGKRLVNKLWNCAKFVSQHFAKLDGVDIDDIKNLRDKISHPLDQWFLNKISDLIKNVTQEFEKYEYASAMHLVERFFWSDFCDDYLEITKTRSYDEKGEDKDGSISAIISLHYTLKTILKLFAPFVPHITEELYQLFSDCSIHAKGNWPTILNFEFNYKEDEAETLIEILNLVRKAKAEKNLSVKTEIKLLQVKSASLSTKLVKDLMNVCNVIEIEFASEFSDGVLQINNENILINVNFN